MSIVKVEQKYVHHYGAYLKENSRPPSRGGNTGAWHQHVLTVEGEKYSFVARGAKKWVFAKDLVTFEWEWDASQRYRNIKPETLFVTDKDGERKIRGDRSSKSQSRTAVTRPPVSRREERD